MYRRPIMTLAIATAVMASGCSNSSSSPADSRISSAREKIQAASDTTIEAARAKRDEYARAMQKQLDQLNAKYDDLKGRTARAEGQAKKDLEKKLEVAKAKRDVAAKKLDELKEAGLDRWEKVKEGVGNALDDLKKVFD